MSQHDNVDSDLYLRVDPATFDVERRTLDFNETPRANATHVVLPVAKYDDLVRRATAHDRYLADVSPRRRAYYAALLAALADNGYVGTWHANGSVTWQPAPNPATVSDPAAGDGAADHG